MDKTVEDVLKERQKTHGEFKDMAQTSQAMKRLVTDAPYPDVIAEALDMIVHKLARVRNGNCMEKDHWVDIAGYATLVSKWLDSKDSSCYKTGDSDARAE